MLATVLAWLVFGTLGALEWRRIVRSDSSATVENALQHARHLLGVVPVALAFLAAQLAAVVWPAITWNAPVWLELHYSSIVLAGVTACIAVVFGLATYAAFASRHRHRVWMAVASLLVFGVVLDIQHDFTAPIWPRLRERVAGSVVLQSDSASCGAASAANLARAYGMARSEADMAALVGTTRLGSTPAQLVEGLERIGLACRKVQLDSSNLDPAMAPAILFYPPSSGHVGHTVVLANVDGEMVVVNDPLVGELHLSAAQLAERWTGYALRCLPPSRAASVAS